MTRGIPARLKRIETGYTLDPAGTCGKDCKICKKWNLNMLKDSLATLKAIQLGEKNYWNN
jgi:hypothetical protein